MYVDDTPPAFDKEQGYVKNYHAICDKGNKLTIPSLFLAYSFQVSTIKISYFKPITNWPKMRLS